MKNYLRCIIAVLALAFLAGCASSPLGSDNFTMRGTKAEDKPPAPAKTIAEVPAGQSTYHYKVDIYPGLDENFNPNPTLTLKEHNQLSQLDWYCAKEVDKIAGQWEEMAKQGTLYGASEGLLGALGYRLGFGSMIKPGDYLIAIGMTALGGGLASGKITFDSMLHVAHGYCMTGNVYKADRLEGKLSRIFITPLSTGRAMLPAVSDKPAPVYKGGFISAPPK